VSQDALFSLTAVSLLPLVHPQIPRKSLINNAAERAIRPLVLGRRNWTFAGPDSRDERAATIHTIIETAKFSQLAPKSDLCQLIATIADHPTKRIDELMPWNVQL